MSRNLTTLLEQAALLRSCGASWESVGRKTGRRAGTCRGWPKRYADKWNPLYREASAARYEELGNEAEMTLRHLLRDDDKKWQIKSAEVLLQHRNIPAAITENTFPNDGQERMTAVEWSRKNHHQEMDGWRASRGLPPYQTEEERLGDLPAFYEHRDKEALDYYRHVLQVEESKKPATVPLPEAMEINSPSPTGSSIILPTLLALMGLAVGVLVVERRNELVPTRSTTLVPTRSTTLVPKRSVGTRYQFHLGE